MFVFILLFTWYAKNPALSKKYVEDSHHTLARAKAISEYFKIVIDSPESTKAMIETSAIMK